MKIPNHIALIPDGNRRWATLRNLKPWEGHKEGVQRFWETAQDLIDMGVSNLTIWAASYDNLQKRNKIEVEFLLNILKKELENDTIINLAHKNETKIKVIGEWRTIIPDKNLIHGIEGLESATASHNKGLLTLLFCYDGQREMLSAINQLKNSKEPVDAKNLQKHLWTGNLPDVDLVIRTGGEPHWSAGFMMWLTANSQFYFTETLWPDFKKNQLIMALNEYAKRERRVGK